ncbi:hypothetical protein JYT11_00710 [Planctomycetaceae bacterium AH-315-I19]|nr:hypothetical protein [Planctomycetaceae bacterium AH-315-I19]
MPNLIVFDDGIATLRPLTDLRPAFDVRTGALTTLERLSTIIPAQTPACLHVPGCLARLTREAHPDTPVNELPDGESLLVSGRWLLPEGLSALAHNSALSDAATGHLLAMRADREHIASFLANNAIPRAIANTPIDNAAVLEHPWDVIRHRDACIAHDLGHIATRIPFETESDGVTMLSRNNIFIHECANVLPSVALDATNGPIVIDEGATVRLGAVIIGPAYIGPYSTVLDQALIKSNTAVGPACKVAGELGGTIIQGNSNKAHDGHIGDSWIGEWVNLGAGTTNSNLLNTYGEVAAISGGRRHRTGLTFLGTIAGDHTKTAISTRLMTGTIIGTGAMIASTAPPPEDVPPFAWLTDSGSRSYRIQKFVDVMRTVMARRNATPSDAYTARIRELAELCAP